MSDKHWCTKCGREITYAFTSGINEYPDGEYDRWMDFEKGNFYVCNRESKFISHPDDLHVPTDNPLFYWAHKLKEKENGTKRLEA